MRQKLFGLTEFLHSTAAQFDSESVNPSSIRIIRKEKNLKSVNRLVTSGLLNVSGQQVTNLQKFRDISL